MWHGPSLALNAAGSGDQAAGATCSAAGISEMALVRCARCLRPVHGGGRHGHAAASSPGPPAWQAWGPSRGQRIDTSGQAVHLQDGRPGGPSDVPLRERWEGCGLA
eukprot:scaffold1588_cov408-Prasinococcus_capsulatus_cf.AAC.2